MEKTATLSPGDVVDVPWGLDTVPGTIVESYASGGIQRVRVSLQVPGSDAKEEIVIRVADLLARPSTTEFSSSGSWVRYAQYEHELASTLSAILKDIMADSNRWRVITHWSNGRREADIIIELPHAVAVIDVKWNLTHLADLAVPQLKRTMTEVQSALGRPTVGIIVSPKSPMAANAGRTIEGSRLAEKVYIVKWVGHTEDTQLREIIRDVLAPA